MSILSPNEVQALHEALDDEYRAWATYDQVIQDFGPTRPFINIRDAEARHIEALHQLFRGYEIEIPENPWRGRTDRFLTIQDACKYGAEAEIKNNSLYSQLMASTTREDILVVFRNLQRASQERHLPAFQRCAEREGHGGNRKQNRQGRSWNR